MAGWQLRPGGGVGGLESSFGATIEWMFCSGVHRSKAKLLHAVALGEQTSEQQSSFTSACAWPPLRELVP